MNCPCKDCLCISLCINKTYMSLFRSCSLFKEYIYPDHYKIEKTESEMSLHRKLFVDFILTLKPKRWYIHRIGEEGDFILSGIPDGENPNQERYTSFLKNYMESQL